MECNDRTRIVPLVCKENWEEFLRCSPDAGFVVRLEVKKLAMVKRDPLGMFTVENAINDCCTTL